MLVKIHNSYRKVVSICDKELIGKRFEEKNLQIDIKKSFFEGEEKTEKEVIEIMELAEMEDATFNIVGKRAVSIALKSRIIKKEGIKTIQGVPVALVLL